jgi:hypothetical protein
MYSLEFTKEYPNNSISMGIGQGMGAGSGHGL